MKLMKEIHTLEFNKNENLIKMKTLNPKFQSPLYDTTFYFFQENVQKSPIPALILLV